MSFISAVSARRRAKLDIRSDLSKSRGVNSFFYSIPRVCAPNRLRVTIEKRVAAPAFVTPISSARVPRVINNTVTDGVP